MHLLKSIKKVAHPLPCSPSSLPWSLLVGGFNPFEKSARTVGAKRACLSGCTNTVSFRRGGGGPFFCR